MIYSEISQLERAIEETKPFGQKKIALINPPAFFLTDDRVFFSLGLLNIAAVAREAGHEVQLEDLSGRNDYLERAKELVSQNDFDFVGLTATSPQYGFAHKILEEIKSENPELRVVLGGPHATMFANLRKRKIHELDSQDPSLKENTQILEKKLSEFDRNFGSLNNFDQIIEGEELGIFEVIKDLENNDPRKWVYSGIITNLDSLPRPARDLINMDDYTFKENGVAKFDINGGPATSVISQRGCPFSCLFCSGRNVPQYRNIRSGGIFRAHSPERLVEEFNLLNSEYDFTRFMIYDDELNISNSRFIKLMQALEQNNLQRESNGLEPYHFRGFVKSELFVKHPEQAHWMKRAGFSELLSGFESGSDRILNHHVRKHTTTEINYQASRLAFDNGLRVKALTMVGHPTETYEDIIKTKEFLIRIGDLAQERQIPWQFDITILTPYPGSPIYDQMVKNTGQWKEEYPKVYGNGALYMRDVDFREEGVGAYKTAPGELRPIIRTSSLSGDDLYRLRNEIDGELREKYNVAGYERKEIEHSMGQSG